REVSERPPGGWPRGGGAEGARPSAGPRPPAVERHPATVSYSRILRISNHSAIRTGSAVLADEGGAPPPRSGGWRHRLRAAPLLERLGLRDVRVRPPARRADQLEMG